MKKKILLLMAGLVVFTFGTTCVYAFDIEDDMAEGLKLSSKQDDTKYKYDSLHADAKESMTEFDFFPEPHTNKDHFNGDPSYPSMHELLNEGICMDSIQRSVAAN